MRPLPWQPRPHEGVNKKGGNDTRYDPARRPPAGLDHEKHKGYAEEHVERRGHDIAIPDVVAAGQEIDDAGDAEDGADDIPPHEPVAKPRNHREEQIDEQQHEADVHRAQHLRRNDLDRSVEVEEAHDDQEPGRRAVQPALKSADRTLLLLDEFLGLLQSLIGDEQLFRRLRPPVGVGHSNPPLGRRRRDPLPASAVRPTPAPCVRRPATTRPLRHAPPGIFLPPGGMAAASRSPDS